MEENDDDGDEDHEDELADLESAPAATAEADELARELGKTTIA
jgi:hypothetical protein